MTGTEAPGVQAAEARSVLVSILIVVYQSRAELNTLLQQLRGCDLRSAEVVVVDGGSTDGTIELLRSTDDVVTRWISEPDRGIYDAMNKALDLARGEYVLHLNAGDGLRQLPSQTLQSCLAEGVDVAAFAVMVDGRKVFRPTINWRSRIANTLHHQGTFYRRQSHGRYDPSYRVFGDFDLNERMRRSGCHIAIFDEIVADHSTGGASAIGARTPALREIWRTVRRNAGLWMVPVAWLWMHLYFVVRWWRQRQVRG